MPAASTYKLSVQVSDFEDNCLLIQLARLVCDFCSSSQRFACGFLQIPPRDGHPCRPANSSPCRACRRLSLPSLGILVGCGSLWSHLEVLRPNATPNGFFPHVLWLAKLCAQLRRGHAHQSQHVVILGTLNRTGLPAIHDI